MRNLTKAAIASALFAGCCSVAPAQAQLLGGVSDTVQNLVSVDSGPASSESSVNVGIGNGGGDSGNILDI